MKRKFIQLLNLIQPTTETDSVVACELLNFVRAPILLKNPKKRLFSDFTACCSSKTMGSQSFGFSTFVNIIRAPKRPPPSKPAPSCMAWETFGYILFLCDIHNIPTYSYVLTFDAYVSSLDREKCFTHVVSKYCVVAVAARVVTFFVFHMDVKYSIESRDPEHNRTPIMNTTLRDRLRMILPTLLVLIISIHRIESFQLGPKVAQNDIRFSSNHHHNIIKTSEQQNLLSMPTHFCQTSPSSTQIYAKGKGGKEEPEREEKNALELVLLYLTPWRNPNSIFLYLFGIVYFLGKYSEATILNANGSM